MELRDYLRILHKNWILIVTCTLLGVAAASAVSIMATPKYFSNTELYVSVRSGGEAEAGDLVQGTSFARQAVTSYVSVVNTARVLQPVIENLNLDLTAQQLSSQMSASSPLNTVLIEVTVTDDDPVLAAASWSAAVSVPGAMNLTESAAGYLIATVSTDPGCVGVQLPTLPPLPDALPLPELVEGGTGQLPVSGCFPTAADPESLAGNIAVSEGAGTLWLWAGDALVLSSDGGTTWE